MVATVLGKLPFFKIENKVDFDALRIAAAFPNIVALPILIFPTLCEYAVVHDSFYEGDDETTLEGEKYKSCVDQSNAMIFVYFFAWNFLYWILGYPTLVAAGRKRQIHSEKSISSTAITLSGSHFESDETEVKAGVCPDQTNNEDGSSADRTMPIISDNGERNKSGDETKQLPQYVSEATDQSTWQVVKNAFIQTMTSPGFIAMVLGFITGCIPPLRDALFEPGSSLRFLGSALESLGIAGTSVGTLIVAASLVHQVKDDDLEDEDTKKEKETSNSNEVNNSLNNGAIELDIPSESSSDAVQSRRNLHDKDRQSTNNDPTQQHSEDDRASIKRRSSVSQLGSMVRRRSSLALAAIRRRKPTLRMHAWFIASRLIVAPAVVCLVIVGMDCGGVLSEIPPLAKMVVIVNAGLPGAQLIVITLKSKGLSDSASIVAKVYLPSYLLSVVTIAAWTSVGLFVSIPGDDGTSFCNR